jgi:hypothetical protein
VVVRGGEGGGGGVRDWRSQSHWDTNLNRRNLSASIDGLQQ